jgi:hypothetical protein
VPQEPSSVQVMKVTSATSFRLPAVRPPIKPAPNGKINHGTFGPLVRPNIGEGAESELITSFAEKVAEPPFVIPQEVKGSTRVFAQRREHHGHLVGIPG